MRSAGQIPLVALGALAAAMTWAPPHGFAAERTVAERYARAAKLRWPTTSTAMKNALVAPHWIGATDSFWYRRQTVAGSDFVVVDAATGARRSAFDAKAVAASLTGLTKTAVSTDTLPFATFDYEADGGIAFAAKGDRYRCAVSGVCEKLGPAPTPDMVVSPDKRAAVFVRDGNLWLRDLATGADRALTLDGTARNGWGLAAPPGDLHAIARQRSGGNAAPSWTFWSPDSSRLITTRVDMTGVADYPYIDYAPPDGSFRPKAMAVPVTLTGDAPAKFDLYAVDIASGRRTRLDLPSRIETIDISPKALVWGPGGSHAYLAAMDADMTAARLLDLDLETGRVREVIKEAPAYPALLSAGFYDAAEVAVLPKTSEAIWFSQRDGWGHLYLYDLKTGRLKGRITRGPWVVRAIVKVDEAKRQVYVVGVGREGGNPYHRSLYRVGLDGKGLVRLTPEPDDKPMVDPSTGRPGFDGTPSFQPVSPDGRYLAYTIAPLATPSHAVVRRTDGTGAPITFETADITALTALGFKPPEPFVAKAADARSDIYGVVYRPSDYDPAKRYPVLDAQYASPLTTIAPRGLAQSATNVMEAAPPAADAELGLIVVVMDARGTPLRGAAFSTPAPGYLADMGLTDHVAVIRELAARDPSMDLDRVGITGASFGGWTAIRALIRHNDLYKVGVAWAPPGAFHDMYDTPGLTAAQGLATYAGGSHRRPKPSDTPVNWKDADSIAQVADMKGRLLLGSGALDENVVPGSTMQFMDAAAKANKNVEQMFLPETNHGPVVYFDYVTRRIWDFFIRNLRGETPPIEVSFPPMKMSE